MPIDVIMPKVDMVMEEGTVALWHKAEGDLVQAGEPLLDIETDKATMAIEAPASGRLAQITAPNGTTVPVATVIACIVGVDEQLEPPTIRTLPQPTTPAPRLRATPLARKLARAHGLDLVAVRGGGPQGRIRKGDVLAALASPQVPLMANGGPSLVAQLAPVAAPPAAVPPRAVAAPAAGQLMPLVGARKVIAQRLTASAAIPQFAISMDADLTAALALRERLAYRPSLTAILARVVAGVLPRHPLLNASFRSEGIWLHTPVHLGIALDSSGDLLVPVIRDAQQLTLQAIGQALADIRTRAVAKQLMPIDLQGSTFSISNLGMYGVGQLTPLINPPEAAILGVGQSRRQPVEIEGAIVFRPMLTLTLSVDHRVADGATAARFLQELRAVVEEPFLLL